MTTPSPPRLTGDTSKDIFSVSKYMGDLYNALITAGQLLARATRLAAVNPVPIAIAAPNGTKVTALTPIVLPAFSDPPTALEMAALRAQINNLTAAVLEIIQAAQLQ